MNLSISQTIFSMHYKQSAMRSRCTALNVTPGKCCDTEQLIQKRKVVFELEIFHGEVIKRKENDSKHKEIDFEPFTSLLSEFFLYLFLLSPQFSPSIYSIQP